MQERAWDILEQYRPSLFKGQWPSIPTMFSITLARYPDNPAFTTIGSQGKSYTYAQADVQIKRIAAYMQSKGIGKEDKVVLNGKNSPEWAMAYLATQFCGATVVPLDNQLSPERVNALGKFSQAKMLIADVDVIEKLDKDQWFTSLNDIIMLDKTDAVTYRSIHTVSSDTDYIPVYVDGEDIAAILFTSGTTGNEKGVVLSHANITSNVYQAGDRQFLSIENYDVFYALLPLHHSYTMTAVFLESIMHGCNLIFGHQMVVTKILNDMRQGKVT
ncbi:MAG: class I adenylate-forming enzyme family protein, partial [Sphaerochaetaceae bacterium]